MSSAIIILVLEFLSHGAFATVFPPSSNPPPIPAASIRTLDIAGQKFIQEDIPPNPQFVIKEDVPYPVEPVEDEQRWFYAENQPELNGDYTSSTETFDRYYQNGDIAIGPVATPIPDDTYVAQPSSTSKIIPEGISNARSSDVWILTKGASNQYAPERWIQIPTSRVVEVVNADASPKVIPESGKSIPAPPAPIKSQFPTNIPQSPVQQVWVKAPSFAGNQKVYTNAATVLGPGNQKVYTSAATVLEPGNQKVYTNVGPVLEPGNQKVYTNVGPVLEQGNQKVYTNVAPVLEAGNQKVYTNGATVLEEISPVQEIREIPPPPSKQTVEVPPPRIKQYVEFPPQNVRQLVDYPVPNVKEVYQPQVTKDMYLPPPPPPKTIQQVAQIPKKGTQFTLPPPPPPPVKGADITSSKQYIPNVPIAAPVVKEKSGPIYMRERPMPVLRHIWIPTSAQTGKFLSVPVADAFDSGKSISEKGVPVNAPPVVSDTWVLKQDGSLPRFEPQKGSIPMPIVQNQPVIPIPSPKNIPISGKSIDSAIPLDVWLARKNIYDANVAGKAQISAPVFPVKAQKSEAPIVGKGEPAPFVPQKSIYAGSKSIPPPPPAPLLPPPTGPVINGKPCPVPPPVKGYQPKGIPLPALQRPQIIKRPPLSRIIRINRRPYGSYYVLNNRLRPSYYTYPRQSNILQQTKNGMMRLIPANPITVPVRPRQFTVPAGKSSSPLLYPQLQPISRVRYAYPWSNYLSSYALPGRNVFVPQGLIKGDILKLSSSESSSSESSESKEEKKEKKKEKKKEVKKEAKKEVKKEESEEKKSEMEETESVEVKEEKEPESEPSKESEKESEEAAASEAQESIEVAESQLSLQAKTGPETATNTDQKIKLFPSPYLFGYRQSDSSGRKQHRQEASDPDGRVTGEYGFTDRGIYRLVSYTADENGYRAHVITNEPGTISHASADVNSISNWRPENTTVSEKSPVSTEVTTEADSSILNRDR